MSESELRAAGVRIDLPSEAASPNPGDIRYTDGTTLSERLRARYERETGRTESTQQPDAAVGADYVPV